MRVLAVNTPWGVVEPIQSNNFSFCIRCGIKITEENDSGWEYFKSDGRTTQSICKVCHVKDNDNLTGAKIVGDSILCVGHPDYPED